MGVLGQEEKVRLLTIQHLAFMLRRQKEKRQRERGGPVEEEI